MLVFLSQCLTEMVFVIFLMFLTSLWTNFENGVQCMSELAEYANYVSWKNGLEFHDGCCMTLEKCLNQCRCKAVFHKEETYQCHLYKAVLQSPSDATAITGWRYYTINCDDGWFKYGSKCYKASTFSRPWTDAQTECNARAGNLAVIDSAEIMNAVAQIVSTSYRYWIGGKSEDGPKNFKWYPSMTNITGSYTNWARGEPNNQGVICVEIRGDLTDFLWNDNYCYNTKPFICEKSL